MDSGLMNEVYLDTLTFIRVLSDSSWIGVRFIFWWEDRFKVCHDESI